MSIWIRQFHRWMAAIFMVIVIGIFVALGLRQEPPLWVYYLPLAPLGLLMLTGLYLFVLPYVTGWSRGSE
jgi:hypothetical protein